MDIIAMARELGKAIQQDERYKRIDAAKTANDKDEELQQLIQKFNMKRSELSVEMAQENKNPEKLNQLDRELKAVYQEVMQNPNMAEFNAAKVEVDDMMNYISTILYGAVNGEDPDTIEPQQSCGGDCAGCAGRRPVCLPLIPERYRQPVSATKGCWLTLYQPLKRAAAALQRGAMGQNLIRSSVQNSPRQDTTERTEGWKEKFRANRSM